MIDRRDVPHRAALLLIGFVATLFVACSQPDLPAGPPTQTRNVTPVASATQPPATTPAATRIPATPSATAIPATATPVSTASPAEFPPPGFIDNSDCSEVSRTQLPLADVVISDGTRSVSVTAEMARTATEHSQGLMCRSSVPPGTGMLFMWDTERSGGFWMFNTYVPLDIIYFGNEAGEVSIREMTPCPRDGSEADNTWRNRCGDEAADYLPGISYTTTLELPLGWLEEMGFDTANPVEIGVSLNARD